MRSGNIELKSDLAEHRSVIETLRGKLNEVNLLNAKLLFTNKLFRKHGLNTGLVFVLHDL